MSEIANGISQMLDRVYEQSNEIERLRGIIADLTESLEWMIDNDETNEGDVPMEWRGGRTWDEINAYWIDGLNRARASLARAKGGQS